MIVGLFRYFPNRKEYMITSVYHTRIAYMANPSNLVYTKLVEILTQNKFKTITRSVHDKFNYITLDYNGT